MEILEANILVFLAYTIPGLLFFIRHRYKYIVKNNIKNILLMLAYSKVKGYHAILALVIKSIHNIFKAYGKKVEILFILITLVICLLTVNCVMELLPFLSIIMVLLYNKVRRVSLSYLFLIASVIPWMIYCYQYGLILEFIYLTYDVCFDIIYLIKYLVDRKRRNERITKLKGAK